MTTRIMIAEDNTSIISCYHDLLSKDETIEIVVYAKDGETTIEMYKKKTRFVITGFTITYKKWVTDT